MQKSLGKISRGSSNKSCSRLFERELRFFDVSFDQNGRKGSAHVRIPFHKHIVALDLECNSGAVLETLFPADLQPGVGSIPGIGSGNLPFFDDGADIGAEFEGDGIVFAKHVRYFVVSAM